MSERAATFSWSAVSAILLLLAGLALIALSVIWPKVFSTRSRWTDDKALAYQSASAEMHRLSMQMAAAEPEKQTRALQDELARAEARYAELRAELDAVRGQPRRIATILRYTGIVLLLGGAIGVIAKRGHAAAA